MKIRDFMKGNFKHFNAATTVDAAEAWINHLDQGGRMLLAMAGAMSTGELGISLSEMIRQGKIHAISTTGANLEEDIFNLVAHESYKRLPNYRSLSVQQEVELYDQGLNRVTDTCIPEEEAMRKIESHLLKLWQEADQQGRRYFPYQYFYQMLERGMLEKEYQIDPKHSWVVAAWQKGLPIFTAGWEDSTLGNHFVSHIKKGHFKSYGIMKSGLELMGELVEWYQENVGKKGIGFFQIGGGIAGDFAICVVPLIIQDLRKSSKFWSYFCQISDSTTSYGSYSGAVPNEKITWGKLDADTPSFIIESDAAIVAPLIFNYVLDR